MSETERIIEQAQAAESRGRRWGVVEWALVCLALAALIGVVVFATINTLGQRDIRASQHQQACVAKITAEFQGAVGDALLAPPAPNPARTDAVNRIKVASDQLHHLDRYCPN